MNNIKTPPTPLPQADESSTPAARMPNIFETFPAGLAFTALALLIWLFVWDDYGISWDQSVDLRFGQAVLRYFTEGFNYQHIAEYPVSNLKFYSPLVALLSSTVAQITGFDVFSCGAAVIGLFWVATFWPVCCIGQSMGGKAVSWLAGIALLAMPAYMGHGFINTKDLPFACAVSWFLLAILWATQRSRMGLFSATLVGLAFGLVLAVRPGGFFVGALLLFPLLQHGTGIMQGKLTMDWKKFLYSCLWLGVSGILAWMIMVAPWPSAHRNPILHPFESMVLASEFHEAYPVLFQGEYHQSNKLPWHYFFVYFGVTIPPLILIGAMTGQARQVWMFFTGRDRSQMGSLLFLVWFPLLAFVVLRMNVYDGVRHFLFLLPLFAVSAALGGIWLAECLPKSLGVWRAGLIAAVFCSSLPNLRSLHPYQYTYYNFMAGPRESLHQRFETDYWVTSYREAAEWINRIARPNPRVILAANAFSEPAFLHYVKPGSEHMSVLADYSSTPFPTEADFYVGTVRYGQDRNFSATPIRKVIEREGIRMAVIRSPHN